MSFKASMPTLKRRDGFRPISKGICTKAKAKLSAGIWTQHAIPNCHVYNSYDNLKSFSYDGWLKKDEWDFAKSTFLEVHSIGKVTKRSVKNQA